METGLRREDDLVERHGNPIDHELGAVSGFETHYQVSLAENEVAILGGDLLHRVGECPVAAGRQRQHRGTDDHDEHQPQNEQGDAIAGCTGGHGERG